MDSASSEGGGNQATPNGSEAENEAAALPVKLAGDALEELLEQMEEYAPTVSFILLLSQGQILGEMYTIYTCMGVFIIFCHSETMFLYIHIEPHYTKVIAFITMQFA